MAPSSDQPGVRVALLDSNGNNLRIHYLDSGEPGFDVPGVVFSGFRLDWKPKEGWKELLQDQPNETAVLQAELAQIRNAAEWLIANRGHRGEQQAWKLLADALAKEPS